VGIKRHSANPGLPGKQASKQFVYVFITPQISTNTIGANSEYKSAEFNQKMTH